MANFNSTATLNLKGKDELSKVLDVAQKGMSNLADTIVKSTENIEKQNKAFVEGAKQSKAWGEGIVDSVQTVKQWNQSTKGAAKDVTDFGSGIIKTNEVLTEMTSGIKGVALGFTGFKDEANALNSAIDPVAGHLIDIADAGNNTERAFIILDKVAEPLQNTFKATANQLERAGKFFQDLEQTAAQAASGGLAVASKGITFFSGAVDSMAESLKQQGLVGRLIASQFSGLSGVLDKTAKQIDGASKSIDPENLNKVDKAGQALSGTFDKAGKSLDKAALGVKLADTVGDTYRGIKGAKEFGAVMAGPLAIGLGVAASKMDIQGKLMAANNQKWQTTQKLAHQANKSIKDGMLKTLAQMTLKAGDLVILVQTLKTIASTAADITYSFNGVNDAFSTMQAMGIDTHAADIAFQFGIMGEKLLFSSEAAKQFGQAAIAAFAQLEDQAAFVTTLSAGANMGIENITDSMQELVNGPLKNALSSTEATEAFYNTLSAGIGVTYEGGEAMVDMGQSAVFMESALKLAEGSGANAAQTLDTLAKVTNVYKLSNKEAAETAAKMYSIVEEGQVTFAQLSGGLGRVASSAKSANVDIDQTFGAISALTKVMTADDAMTGFASLMNSIAGQGAEAQKTIKELGITFDLNSIKSKGLQQSLNDLYVATNGNAEILKTIIPDSLAYNTAFNLMTVSADAFAQTTENVKNVGGEMIDEVFGNRQQSMIKRMQALMNGFNEAMAGMANSQIIDALLEPGVAFLGKMLELLQSLPDPVKNLIGSVIALQVGFGKILDIGGSVLGLIVKLGLMAISARAMHVLLSGQMLKEYRIIKQLIVGQNDWGAALMRVVGIQKDYTTGALALSEAQTRAAKTQEKLKEEIGKSYNLKNLNDYKAALEDLRLKKLEVEQSGLKVIDPAAYQREIKKLKGLEKEVERVFFGFSEIKVDLLKDVNQSISKNLANAELTTSEKAEGLVKSLESALAPMDETAARQAKKAFDQIPIIIGNTELNTKQKLEAMREVFDLSFAELSPTVRKQLIPLQGIIEQSIVNIESLPKQHHERLSKAYRMMFNVLPESARKAEMQMGLTMEDTAELLTKPFDERREILGESLNYMLANASDEVRASSPKLKAAFEALLSDSTIPLNTRKQYFQQYFAEAFKEAGAQAKKELPALRAVALELVTAFEQPFAIENPTIKFSKGILKGLRDTSIFVRANKDDLFNAARENVTALYDGLKNPETYTDLKDTLGKALDETVALTDTKFKEAQAAIELGIGNLNFDTDEAAAKAKEKLEQIGQAIQTRFVQQQLSQTRTEIQGELANIEGALQESASPEAATNLMLDLRQALESFDFSNTTGSMESLRETIKSSLENIGDDVSTEDLQKIEGIFESSMERISGVVDSAMANIEWAAQRVNIGPVADKVTQQMKALVDGLKLPELNVESFDEFHQGLAEVLADTSLTVQERTAKIRQQGTQLVEAFGEGFKQGADKAGINIDEFKGTVQQKIQDTLQALNKTEQIKAYFKNLDIPFIDTEALEEFHQGVAEVLIDTTLTIQDRKTQIEQKARELSTGFVAGFQEGFDSTSNFTLEEFRSKLDSEVNKAISSLNRAEEFKRSFSNLRESITNEFKHAFKLDGIEIDADGLVTIEAQVEEVLTGTELTVAEKRQTLKERLSEYVDTLAEKAKEAGEELDASKLKERVAEYSDQLVSQFDKLANFRISRMQVLDAIDEQRGLIDDKIRQIANSDLRRELSSRFNDINTELQLSFVEFEQAVKNGLDPEEARANITMYTAQLSELGYQIKDRFDEITRNVSESLTDLSNSLSENLNPEQARQKLNTLRDGLGESLESYRNKLEQYIDPALAKEKFDSFSSQIEQSLEEVEQAIRDGIDPTAAKDKLETLVTTYSKELRQLASKDSAEKAAENLKVLRDQMAENLDAMAEDVQVRVNTVNERVGQIGTNIQAKTDTREGAKPEAPESSGLEINEDLKSGVEGLAEGFLENLGVDTGQLRDIKDVASGVVGQYKDMQKQGQKLAESQELIDGVNRNTVKSFEAQIQAIRMNVAEKGVLARTNKLIIGAGEKLATALKFNGKMWGFETFGVQASTTAKGVNTAATGTNTVAVTTNTGATGLNAIASKVAAAAKLAWAGASGFLTGAISVLNAALGVLWTLLGPITLAVGAVVAAFFVLKAVLEAIFPGLRRFTTAQGRLAAKLIESNKGLDTQIQKLDEYKQSMDEASKARLQGAEFDTGEDEEGEDGVPDKAYVTGWMGWLVNITEKTINLIVGQVINKVMFVPRVIKGIFKTIWGMASWFGEQLDKMLFGIPGKVKNFIIDKLPFKGMFKTADSEVDNLEGKFFKFTRGVGNNFRDTIQNYVRKPLLEAAEEVARTNDALFQQLAETRSDWNAGEFTTEPAKEIVQRAKDEGRALKAEELQEAIALEREYAAEEVKIAQARADEIRDLIENDKKVQNDPVVRKRYEQELAALDEKIIAQEKSLAIAIRYNETQTAIASTMATNAAAADETRLAESVGNLYENLGEEQRAGFKNLLGIQIEEVENAEGELEATVSDFGNIKVNNARQRQVASQLAVSLEQVYTTAARMSDPNNPATVDELKNSYSNFSEAITAAAEEGAIDPDTAGRLQDELLNGFDISAQGVEGKLRDILPPDMWQGVFQQRIADIEKLGKREVRINEENLKEIAQQEALKEISGLSATKQRAEQQAIIDQNMVSIREKQLQETIELEGEGSEAVILARQALRDAENTAAINSFKSTQEINEKTLESYKSYMERRDWYTQAALEKETNQYKLQKEAIQNLQKADQASDQARQAISDYEVNALNNQLKLTGDLTEKAAINTEIAEKKQKALEAGQAFEAENLEIQIKLQEMDLISQKNALEISKLEADRNLIILDRQLLTAEENKLSQNEILSLKQQRAAMVEQNALIEGQIANQDQAIEQNKQIADDQRKALQARQKAAKENSALEIELAKQAEVIAGYDEQIKKIELAAKRQDIASQERINALEMQSKLMDQQVKILEKQKSIIDSRADSMTSAYDIAIAAERSEYRKRRLEEERERAKMAALLAQQQMEQKVFELQQLQTEMAAERMVIEAEIALVKAQSEAASARAEAAKVNARQDATEEEKEAASLAVEAADMGVKAAEQGLGLSQENLSMTRQMATLEEETFYRGQADARMQQEMAVAQTTRRRSDDRAVQEQALNQARGLNDTFIRESGNAPIQPSVPSFIPSQLGPATPGVFSGAANTIVPTGNYEGLRAQSAGMEREAMGSVAKETLEFYKQNIEHLKALIEVSKAVEANTRRGNRQSGPPQQQALQGNPASDIKNAFYDSMDSIIGNL